MKQHKEVPHVVGTRVLGALFLAAICVSLQLKVLSDMIINCKLNGWATAGVCEQS
jgi:hypothetical protein